MSEVDMRCGTCRYFEPRAPRVPESQYGHCDWTASHLVDIIIPYWVLRGDDRAITHKYHDDCKAWKAKL